MWAFGGTWRPCGEMKGDGGDEVAFEGELVHDRVLPSSHVVVPPSLDSLDM